MLLNSPAACTKEIIAKASAAVTGPEPVPILDEHAVQRRELVLVVWRGPGRSDSGVIRMGGGIGGGGGGGGSDGERREGPSSGEAEGTG